MSPLQLRLSRLHRSPNLARLWRVVTLGALAFAASAAHADQIKVLTTGAFKQVVLAFVPQFEAQTGHKVTVENDTAGALVKRLDGGETFDVLVLTPGPLKQYADKGRVIPASQTTLARVGIGIAVKNGAPLPEVKTVEQFKQALLAAKKVAYIDPAAGGSSGIYLTGLFQKMGITEQIWPKAVLVPGGLVATRLVSGEADLAIHQVSEILPVAGVTLVAMLPDEIQNFTVYAGAVSAAPGTSATARAFLSLMAGAGAAETIRAKGMLPGK